MTDSVKFEYALRQAAEKRLRDEIDEFMSGEKATADIGFDSLAEKRFKKRSAAVPHYLTAAAILVVGVSAFVFTRLHSPNVSENPEVVYHTETNVSESISDETVFVETSETAETAESVSGTAEKITSKPESEANETYTEETESPAVAAPAQAARIDEPITSDLAVGGVNTCIHSGIYGDSFHDFPGELIDYVGRERFDEFINTDIPYHGYTADECPFSGNIYEFIKYFDISRETFENIYYTSLAFYNDDFNIDILYGGNEQEIYDYYSSGGNYAEMLLRNADLMIKMFTANYIGRETWMEWQERMGYKNYTYYSIAEMIYSFDIPRGDFENIINAEINKINDGIKMLPKSGHMDENGSFVADEIIEIEKMEFMLKTYDYDVDFIYSEREYIESVIGETEPYKIDRMCHNF